MNWNNLLDKWEAYIRDIGPANDDYERLIRHYNGFNIVYEFKESVLKNLASSILVSFFLKKMKKNIIELDDKYDCVITASDKAYLLNDESLPNELNKKYAKKIRICNEGNSLLKHWNEFCLDDSAVQIINEAYKRFPKQKMMILSLLLHLGRTCMIVHKYNPDAIIVTQAEQDYTSTMITKYCESNGIDYICVQHGEYCYNPSMAFMRFTKYYAWDKETIEILEMTNNKIDFAQIYTPTRLLKTYERKSEPDYFITYYLSDEKADVLQKIQLTMDRFAESGYKCCIRWHPRAFDEETILKYFGQSKATIENPYKVSLGDSIANTKYVVGYRTTVLSEVLASHLDPVIDDVTQDVGLLIRMKDQNYTRIKLRLSSLIQKYIEGK